MATKYYNASNNSNSKPIVLTKAETLPTDITKELVQWAQLLLDGVISEEEYALKRKDILGV